MFRTVTEVHIPLYVRIPTRVWGSGVILKDFWIQPTLEQVWRSHRPKPVQNYIKQISNQKAMFIAPGNLRALKTGLLYLLSVMTEAATKDTFESMSFSMCYLIFLAPNAFTSRNTYPRNNHTRVPQIRFLIFQWNISFGQGPTKYWHRLLPTDHQ